MDLRKMGLILMVLTIIILFISGYFGLTLYTKLFFGTFGLVGGFLLIAIGKIQQ